MKISKKQGEFLAAAIAAGGNVGRPPFNMVSGRHQPWFVPGVPGVRITHLTGEALVRKGALEPVLVPGGASTARLAGSRSFHYRVTQAARDAAQGRRA